MDRMLNFDTIVCILQQLWMEIRQPQGGQPQAGQAQDEQPQAGQPQAGQAQTGQAQDEQPQAGQPYKTCMLMMFFAV